MRAFLIYIVLLQLSICWIPRIVWTFWDKPLEQDHHILQAMHRHHKAVLEPKGWQLRHLNSETMKNWTQPIQKFKQISNHPSWNEMNRAKQVDILRVALLSHYGGIYMDLGTILTTDFNWIFQLKDNENIENAYGEEPEVFFTYARHTQKQKYLDPQTNTNILLYPVIQSYFIASKNTSTYIQECLNFTVDTIIANYPKYRYRSDNDKSIFLEIAQRQKTKAGAYKTKYHQLLASFCIVLNRKQVQLDALWKDGKARKFAVREFGIWSIDVNFNGYSYQHLRKSRENFWHQSFLYYNKDQFLINNKMPVFFKFFHQVYKKFLGVFKTEPSNPSTCYPRFILKSSIMYQYILKDYPVKFYTNQVVNDTYFEEKCRAFVQIDNVFAQTGMVWEVIFSLQAGLRERQAKGREQQRQIQNFKPILKQIKQREKANNDKIKLINQSISAKSQQKQKQKQKQQDNEIQTLKTDLNNLIKKSEEQASLLSSLEEKNAQYEQKIKYLLEEYKKPQDNQQESKNNAINETKQFIYSPSIIFLYSIVISLLAFGILLFCILRKLKNRNNSSNKSIKISTQSSMAQIAQNQIETQRSIGN